MEQCGPRETFRFLYTRTNRKISFLYSADSSYTLRLFIFFDISIYSGVEKAVDDIDAKKPEVSLSAEVPGVSVPTLAVTPDDKHKKPESEAEDDKDKKKKKKDKKKRSTSFTFLMRPKSKDRESKTDAESSESSSSSSSDEDEKDKDDKDKKKKEKKDKKKQDKKSKEVTSDDDDKDKKRMKMNLTLPKFPSLQRNRKPPGATTPQSPDDKKGVDETVEKKEADVAHASPEDQDKKKKKDKKGKGKKIELDLGEREVDAEVMDVELDNIVPKAVVVGSGWQQDSFDQGPKHLDDLKKPDDTDVVKEFVDEVVDAAAAQAFDKLVGKKEEKPAASIVVLSPRIDLPTEGEIKLEGPQVESSKIDIDVPQGKEFSIQTPKVDVGLPKVGDMEIDLPTGDDMKIDLPKGGDMEIDLPKGGDVEIDLPKGGDNEVESPKVDIDLPKGRIIEVETPKVDVYVPKGDLIKIEAPLLKLISRLQQAALT